MTIFRAGRNDGSEQGRLPKNSNNDQVSKMQTTQLFKQMKQRLWKQYRSQLIYVYMGLLKNPQDVEKLKVLAFLWVLHRYVSLHRQSLYGILSMLGSIAATNDSSSRLNHVAFCYQRIHAYMQHMNQYYSPRRSAIHTSAKLQNRGWTKFRTLLTKNHGQFMEKIEERHQTQITVYQNTLEEQSQEITAMTTTTTTVTKKPIRRRLASLNRIRPMMNESTASFTSNSLLRTSTSVVETVIKSHPCQYESSFAHYFIRRPFVEEEDDSIWQKLGLASSTNYKTTALLFEPPSLEILARLLTSASLVFLGPNEDDVRVYRQEADNNRWKQKSIIPEEDDDWLTDIQEEAMLIRELYCSSLQCTMDSLQRQQEAEASEETLFPITKQISEERIEPIYEEDQPALTEEVSPQKKRPLLDGKNVDNFMNKKSRCGSPPLNKYHDDHENDDNGKHRISQFLKSLFVAPSNYLQQSTPKKNNVRYVAMPRAVLPNSSTKNGKDETHETHSSKHHDGHSCMFPEEEVNHETTNSNFKDDTRDGTTPPPREETSDASSSSFRSPSIESTSTWNNQNHWRIWDLFVHFVSILLEYGLWTLLFIVAILNFHVPVDTWA